MRKQFVIAAAALMAGLLLLLAVGYIGLKNRAETAGRARRESYPPPASIRGGYAWSPRAPAPFLDAVPDVRQSTNYSCGAAALQAVLHYWRIDVREGDLMADLGSDPERGTPPEAILRVAGRLGLKAELREGLSVDDLVEALRRGVPPIVDLQAWTSADVESDGFRWADAWEDGHYVVLIGIEGETLIFEDPSLLGARGYIPRAEFLERWRDYEGEPPYRPSDPGDRAYVRAAIFIEGAKPADAPALTKID